MVGIHRDRTSMTVQRLALPLTNLSVITSCDGAGSVVKFERGEGQWFLVTGNLRLTKAIVVVSVGSRTDAWVI